MDMHTSAWLTCIVVTACLTGTYGSNCENTCLNCADEKCDESTGHCVKGCKTGWRGDKCEGEKCDESTGHCDHGCKTGWRGDKCEGEKCDESTGHCDHGC